MSRPNGVFHFEIIAEEIVKLLERFDEEEIEGKPDGASPIRITAKQIRRRFGRLIVQFEFVTVQAQDVRFFGVDA